MEYKDYYQTLGVARDAEGKDIKRAFRKLARQYHPDMNSGDASAEEHFKEINEAYEVLSDPEKRQKYDQLGSAWRDWDRTGRQPGGFDWSQWHTGSPNGERVHVRYASPEDLGDIFGEGSTSSDFFAQIFGGMGRSSQGTASGFGRRAQSRRGQDLDQDIEIDLREAYSGTKRVFQTDGRRLEVKIPAGARTGTRIRLSGEGGPGRMGGDAGDLFLRVRVLPDSQFERKDDELRVAVPVDIYTAVLGGQVEVPTLNGSVVLTVPAGSKNGQTFRLRGKGMPRMRQRGQFGDLLVKIEVMLPATLTPKQEKLFMELRRLSEAEAGGS